MLPKFRHTGETVPISSKWRVLSFLATIGVAFAPAAAYPQSTDHLTRMLALLKGESGSCSFRHEAAGTISAEYNTNEEFIVFWVYRLEGCAGGNNWAVSTAAFYVKQPPKGAASIKKIPLSKNVMEQTTFSQVKNVSFKTDTGTPTSHVEIDGLNMGNDDARCCPTQGQQVKVWIESGQIKSAIVKTWKEPN